MYVWGCVLEKYQGQSFAKDFAFESKVHLNWFVDVYGATRTRSHAKNSISFILDVGQELFGSIP